jgi:hypothetical protein
MDSPKYIYHLIAFSQDHIDGWESIRKREKEFEKLIEGMSREERKEFHSKWRKENTHVPEPRINLGRAYRGCFLDRADLVKIIEAQNDPWGLCECYYEYLLIEKRMIGEIDDTCWGDEDDSETWYKFTQVDEDEWRYLEIPKPECFKQTCNFL